MKRDTRKARSIRLPDDIDTELSRLANNNGHSVNAEILLALRMHIAANAKKVRRESAGEDETRR